MRWLSLALIITGITVFSYPKLSDMYYERQQAKLIEQWQQSFQTIAVIEEDTEQEKSGMVQPALDAPKPEPETAEHTAETELEEAASRPRVEIHEDMDGILYIDKIDLQLPILRGATEHNMKTTVASIENTGALGEAGNYAIAGHRNRTFGRNFNRLDELVAGDLIEIDSGTANYAFVVTEKLYVLPEDVWVLESEGVDQEVTLVTCHPIETGTHRLIIKGVLQES